MWNLVWKNWLMPITCKNFTMTTFFLFEKKIVLVESCLYYFGTYIIFQYAFIILGIVNFYFLTWYIAKSDYDISKIFHYLNFYLCFITAKNLWFIFDTSFLSFSACYQKMSTHINKRTRDSKEQYKGVTHIYPYEKQFFTLDVLLSLLHIFQFIL